MVPATSVFHRSRDKQAQSQGRKGRVSFELAGISAWRGHLGTGGGRVLPRTKKLIAKFERKRSKVDQKE